MQGKGRGVAVSLDVYLEAERKVTVFSQNNLGGMAEAAGIYRHCWRPEEVGITKASELIEPLRKGLAWLKENPEEAKKHNASNGWGLYEHFVPWVEKYLAACEANPDAVISVSR